MVKLAPVICAPFGRDILGTGFFPVILRLEKIAQINDCEIFNAKRKKDFVHYFYSLIQP